MKLLAIYLELNYFDIAVTKSIKVVHMWSGIEFPIVLGTMFVANNLNSSTVI